jgi:glutaredoxin
MEIEDQFSLEHLLFNERTCRSCRKTKDLLTDFYNIRKGKKYLPSSYSYECKDCTIQRVTSRRQKKYKSSIFEYPDW